MLVRTVRNTLLCTRRFHRTIHPNADWESNNGVLLDLIRATKKKEPLQKKRPANRLRANQPPKRPPSSWNKEGEGLYQKGGRRKLVINWKTGTDRAKEAINSVIEKIFTINSHGFVNFVNPETHNLVNINIRDLIKGLDLTKKGLSIVNIEKDRRNKPIPLVRFVDCKVALKTYSDIIAKKKEEELVALGVIKKLTGAGSTDKKETTLKHIKISWQISMDDLSNQKAQEIIKLLKKGFKVNIYIDEKKSTDSSNWLGLFDHIEDPTKPSNIKISKKELNQRTSIINRLNDLLNEYSNKPLMEGSLQTRVLMKLAPKPSAVDKRDIKKLKEQRKKERQDKLLKRIEKKKLKEADNN
ncbi:Aim23p NDAI_0G06180 [Naumovozyma dairenensis CBS 421]|uniref:Altered inheritance of mitochondria protein 23, mitochondrial n=1 Tax=Naumovozyma dairenensis (strain ATCC 10597 / BCRC 20456 / CBS 421 / NBRC 0211 / NRRL Y-12639) TaxID=1071378 RepID=J7S4R7_NAUDC|nr:hypothetical protein NDAI_0G06180 [Naumovozyma dairenensis CBS 421]CCK73601.1 hypothetical protein NDAI_0G06180 [Naumovozyma dairenensis CBS 421]